MRLHPRAGHLLALVLGTVVGIVLAEVVARVFLPDRVAQARITRFVESERGKFCRPHPTLGWEGRPGVADTFTWADVRHRVVQNRDGFRGSAYGLPRGPARRVVVLGDSFVWGFGVEEEQLFTSRLERGAPPLEVVNAGVSGYGPDQALLAWRARAAQWAPDEVVLVVCYANDLGDITSSERYGYPKPYFVAAPDGSLQLANVPVPSLAPAAASTPFRAAREGRLAWLVDHSALASLAFSAAMQRPALARTMDAAQLVPRGEPGAPPILYVQPAPPAAEAAWQLLARIVAVLHREVEASGARLSLVAVPPAEEVMPGRWEEMVAALPPPPSGVRIDEDAPRARLARLAAAEGVRLLDVRTALREAARERHDLYFPINGHWTATGHEVVAQSLAPALR